MRRCSPNSMQQEEQFLCKLGSFKGRFTIIHQLRDWMIRTHDISVDICFLLGPFTLSKIANKGNCLLNLNQINEALLEFQRAISMNPHDGLFYLKRALVYARLEKFQNAIDDYTQALNLLNVKDSKNRFESLFQRGNCYRQIKNFDLSIKDLQTVIKFRKNLLNNFLKGM